MPKCPMCEKPTEAKWRPFCSKRCADVDLGNWMTGAYAAPSEDPLSESDVEQILEAREKD